MRAIVWVGLLLGVAFEVVALVSRQEFAAWRVALAGAGVLGALLVFRARRTSGAPGVELPRLLGCVVTVAFTWSGLLEVVLLVKPLVAREMLLVFAGASVHALLLVCADAIAAGRSTVHRVACRIGFVATAAVGSACLVEWLFTERLPAWIYDVVPDDPRSGTLLVARPGLPKALRPGFRGKYVHPEFPGLRVEINALGLRDRPDEGVPPTATDAVVLVLGDSLAFGTGVRLEETFQERLEARAVELTRRPLRVYGAGVPGFGQFDSLHQLEEIGAPLHPDVVVDALYEGNDLLDNLRELAVAGAPDPIRKETRAGGVGATLLRDQLRAIAQLDYWRGSSSALQFLWPALERPLVALGLVPESVPTNAALVGMLRRNPTEATARLGLLTIDALRKLRAKSAELGAAFVVLAIPARVQVEERLFDHYVRANGGAAGDFDRTLFHRRFVAELRAEGFVVVDPLPALEQAARDGHGGYFREGHWNAQGHQIGADALFEPVRDALSK